MAVQHCVCVVLLLAALASAMSLKEKKALAEAIKKEHSEKREGDSAATQFKNNFKKSLFESSSLASSSKVRRAKSVVTSKRQVENVEEVEHNLSGATRTCIDLGISERSPGTFQTPNYPNMYGNNACVTQGIVAPSGQRIRLSFSQLDIEYQSNCNYDRIIVIDAITNRTTYYCGSISPADFVSDSNGVALGFISDGSVTRYGGSLTWTFESASGDTCGAVIGSSGVLSTPNYPSNYGNNDECLWIFSAPFGQRVFLEFSSDFQLESSSSCSFDWLIIMDYVNGEPVYAQFCGSNNPGSVVSYGTDMVVAFHADSSVTFRGFMFTWLYRY